MRAMVLRRAGDLVALDLEEPMPGAGEVAIAVEACGICRTDLHILDEELDSPHYPLVPGHQVVGRVAALGLGVSGLALGQRVGVPWLGATCGHCWYCAHDHENLCDHPTFTGYTRNGGFAERCVADVRYCFPLDEDAPAAALAPLLCAGLIGYRALRLAGDDARIVGLYGFGSAAHILTQVARHEGRTVYAFTRPGDEEGQAFARQLGATWAGGSDEPPPQPLDAALLFAPLGALVPLALRAVRKGGRVVCAGIHMSDIPSFPYRDLWEERHILSVANLTRQDGRELLALAREAGVRTIVKTWPLEDAALALDELRHGQFHGSGVLLVGA